MDNTHILEVPLMKNEEPAAKRRLAPVKSEKAEKEPPQPPFSSGPGLEKPSVPLSLSLSEDSNADQQK